VDHSEDPAGIETLPPSACESPAAFYEQLRAAGPLVWNEPTQTWYATRYETVAGLLRDPTLSARPGPEFAAHVGGPDRVAVDAMEAFFDGWMVFSDPPRQTVLRAAAARGYTPRAVQRWRDQIRALADGCLERLSAVTAGGRSASAADLLDGFANPFSVDAISVVLGIPPTDRAQVTRWSRDLMRYLGTELADPEVARESLAAAEALDAYVREQVVPRARRADDPSEAVFADLRHDEAVALFAQLLTGGIEPVAACLASALSALLGDDQGLLDAVADDELPVKALVEEALRFDAPFHLVPRTATAELTLHGRTVGRGRRLVMVIAAANRDPSVFADPAGFRLPERQEPAHLAFGAGAHYCLGAALARLTIGEALEAVARWPGRRRGELVAERADVFGISAWRRVLLTGAA
jgi:cytochrome P450